MFQKYGCLLVLFFLQCKVEEKADSLFFNGKIYTANARDEVVEAIALKNDKIIAVGRTDELLKLKSSTTELHDLEGQFIMPGLIEGHGHFLGLGASLMNLNLLHTKNWKQINEMVESQIKNTPAGEWIEGRGWHQEKWDESPGLTVNGYPYHDDLSRISQNHPVILFHASGHALMANQKAMELAAISSETSSPKGGRIVKDATGRLTGVFEENAMQLITDAYQHSQNAKEPKLQVDLKIKHAKLASQECLKYGITSFQDAGSSYKEIQLLNALCDSQTINLRLYVMLLEGSEGFHEAIRQIPIPMSLNHRFACRSVKAYLDGALGSYGAWLLNSYSDKANFFGQNTFPLEKLESLAQVCKNKGLQLCVHGIGDRGNREILNIYEKNLGFSSQSLRWRIEHAQHLDSNDIKRFYELGVIASMQAIHCTSDAPFVVKRLGIDRARSGAYTWRNLLNSGAHLANGTDCPVESINPFECMYAAITRKRLDTGLEFFPEQKMSRIEALKSYTIWNAYAAFEESLKGSLEVGKLADFVILDRNLLECTDLEVASCKVKQVILGGQQLKLQVD